MARARRKSIEDRWPEAGEVGAADDDGFQEANGGDTASLNMSNRAEAIRSAIREITELEAARKTIGEQISEIKQARIKGDLGMKIGDFNAALRLYQLEAEARDGFFDTLRETFSALGVGEQASFLDALDGAGDYAS